MNKLLLLLVVPIFCYSQPSAMQAIGSLKTYAIFCPCKLFKYYEAGEIFYFCEDKTNLIKYHIKEFKHQDGIDILLNALDQSIYRKEGQRFQSKVGRDKIQALDSYLKKNPNGVMINFINDKAIVVHGESEKKIFFSDERFIASYEIIVSGKNSDVINEFFNKSIGSLSLKRKGFKKRF